VWSDKVKWAGIYMQNCWFSIWDVETRSVCWVLIFVCKFVLSFACLLCCFLLTHIFFMATC
jgi:hypothetical protein